MDGFVLVLLGGIVIVGAGLLAIIAFTRKGPKMLNQDEYRSKWLNIQQSVKTDNPASWQVAIFDADKLLDRALTERGIAGKNLGERLKNSKQLFSNLNQTWTVHKLRNQLAHESNVKLTYGLTQKALDGFKQALKDAGAI